MDFQNFSSVEVNTGFDWETFVNPIESSTISVPIYMMQALCKIAQKIFIKKMHLSNEIVYDYITSWLLTFQNMYYLYAWSNNFN
jgi:hypothetical protein